MINTRGRLVTMVTMVTIVALERGEMSCAQSVIVTKSQCDSLRGVTASMVTMVTIVTTFPWSGRWSSDWTGCSMLEMLDNVPTQPEAGRADETVLPGHRYPQHLVQRLAVAIALFEVPRSIPRYISKFLPSVRSAWRARPCHVGEPCVAFACGFR
jgi:hypothetical protein